jgi:hypothetical protein
MAEKTALPQVNYVSDNPEQDWERFQDAMKRILKTPKDLKTPKERVSQQQSEKATEPQVKTRAIQDMRANG